MGDLNSEWNPEPSPSVAAVRSESRSPEQPGRPVDVADRRAGHATRLGILAVAVVVLVVVFVVVLAGGDAATSSITECRWDPIASEPPEDAVAFVTPSESGGDQAGGEVAGTDILVLASTDEVQVWRQVDGGWEQCSIETGDGG